MNHSAVTIEDLLADFDETAMRWKQFFASNPGASLIPTDIAKSENIGALVWHLYAASLRLSMRLLGEPVGDFEGMSPVRNLDAAWELQSRASVNLRRFLETTNEESLDEIFRFQTRVAGEIAASRRKICLHVFVHTIRHLAQIGPIVRQHGFTPDWPQDILFSHAIR